MLVAEHRGRFGDGHRVNAIGDSAVTRASLGVNSCAPIRTSYNCTALRRSPSRHMKCRKSVKISLLIAIRVTAITV